MNSIQIQFGYELSYEFQAPTAVVLLLHLRPELNYRLLRREQLQVSPSSVTTAEFTDPFGNRATRLIAPPGRLDLSCDAMIEDDGQPTPVFFDASEHPVWALPDDTLQYLLASRYCEVDLFNPLAWSLFGATPAGWNRVQAVCDWVYRHLRFDYKLARPTRTAYQAYQEGTGVCRDFTHLAIVLCRCLNIPARYATGYLGDIGVPVDPNPMDFSAWMEVYLGGSWHIFDVRHNARRIGHLTMARGRDAADVAFTTTFGSHILQRFVVKTIQVPR